MAKSAVKFRETIAEFKRLRRDVKGGNFAPLYLLMGEEGYFIDRLCELLCETTLTEEERAFNLVTLYGKDSSVGQVVNSAKQSPMMGSRMVVVVKEAQMLTSIEKLSHYTTAPSPSTILILCHKEKNLDKRSQLYKSISSGGIVFESVRPRDYEIGGWLTEYVTAKGCSIDGKALTMLTEKLGTDVSKIANELTKLFISLPKGTTQITDNDIEQYIGISKDYNNFELCKAIITRNVTRSIMIADHYAHNPKDNPLLVTLIALFGQFRQIFIFNYLRWLTQHKGKPFPSDGELMKHMRTGNIYALSEIKQVAPSWHNRKVFNILGMLREYDAKCKGLNNGHANDGELLRELLMKIFTI